MPMWSEFLLPGRLCGLVYIWIFWSPFMFLSGYLIKSTDRVDYGWVLGGVASCSQHECQKKVSVSAQRGVDALAILIRTPPNNNLLIIKLLWTGRDEGRFLVWEKKKSEVVKNWIHCSGCVTCDLVSTTGVKWLTADGVASLATGFNDHGFRKTCWHSSRTVTSLSQSDMQNLGALNQPDHYGSSDEFTGLAWFFLPLPHSCTSWYFPSTRPRKYSTFLQ